MGTRFDFVVPYPYPKNIEDIFMEIRLQVLELDMLFNRYNIKSELSLLNEKAFYQTVSTSNHLFEIIQLALKYSEITHGIFDITMDKRESSTQKPNGYQFIELNITESTIHFHEKIKLDLGGIAKGYALEKVKELLKSCSISDAFISFGESSILAIGKHPHGNCWKINICNIYNKSEVIKEIELYNESLSTSGLAWSLQLGSNKPNHHIVNPYTGKFVDENKTITIKTDNPVDAEVLSTSLYINNNESFIKELKQHISFYVLEVQYFVDNTFETVER